MASTILIIEDHTLFREGLKSLLQGRKEYQIVGEASDGRDGIRLAEKLQPDLVLLDLILPGMHGLEVIRKLQKSTKVLAVSMRIDDLFVAEALKSGAAGYVVKEDSFSELVTAIQAVLKGQRYLSQKLDSKKINRLLERLGSNSPHESLTAREHEVLQMAAEGLTSSQIGNLLSISPRTVEMHRGNLMRKLALRSQADLIRFAIRNHIVAA
jgi:two-component system, NarL family, response regulator NreC